MRIAQLATNIEAVPPHGYGGTELIINLLSEEMVTRGHELTLFASADSKTSGKLVSVVESLRVNGGIPARRWQAFDIRLLMQLQQSSCQFDIVHNHMGWQALPWLAQLDCPVVTTNHNPIKDYCAPIYLNYKELPYVAISESYRRLNYGDQLNYVATIYNGIDLDQYDSNGEGRKSGYLLFLGRVCHDKGTAPAIEIAKRLNLPLKIAGKVDAADEAYFEEKIKPHLQGNIEYVGEVNFEQKVALYKEAIAVVYPIAFDEPFGLVMAESLAMGCPVMALDRGSVREVLSDGETAIVGSSIEELVSRFAQVRSIQPELCKRRVREMFGKQKMVDSYLQVYKKLIEAKS